MPVATTTIADRATRLRELHDGARALLVPNAWDAASAVVLERAGFATIATTSAGMAWASGYADGQRMPFHELTTAIRNIAGAVAIPVSVDLEGGYLEQSGGVEQTVRALIEAGAAGINLDDGTYNPADGVIDADEVVERLHLARDSSTAELGVPLFLIGRTELFWRKVGEREARLEESARRLNAYLAAGADCAFVPGVLRRDALQALVAAVDGPLNVMLVPGAAELADLRDLGVARVTLGAGLFMAALGTLESVARDLHAGRLESLGAAAPSDETLAALQAGR